MKRKIIVITVVLMMLFNIISASAEEVGTSANPNFTVQYYANLEVLANSGDTSILAIDTSGGNLPKNGRTPSTKSIYLNKDSSGSYTVATKTQLTEVYSAKEFEYIKAPSLVYFNNLASNGNYILSQIWVLKGGKSASSTNKADWNVYTDPDAIHFTNRSATAAANDDVILIENRAVIRLVYDTAKEEYKKGAAFYDYDISDGKIYKSTSTTGGIYKDQETADRSGERYYIYTEGQGINSDGNYSGKGVKLAFGNRNTRTGLGGEVWNNNTINTGNSKSFKKCTFGIVKGIDSKGNLIYSEGIAVPNLFDDGAAKGKTLHDGKSLVFNQVGDTYALTSVSGTKAADLETFINPSNSYGEHTDIYTNNFWPMDGLARKGSDAEFGDSDDTDVQWAFGSKSEGIYSYDTSSCSLPESDDGKRHNSYFGFTYEIDFKLSEDYVGPLEYIFYGDDDMWVFLDDALICDIGGVHSSIGEYVNLWDYLEKGVGGSHKLKFFYTERGASGSTCYMRFTLPSVSVLAPERNTGDHKVSKKVEGADLDQNFEFTIRLKDSEGNYVKDDYVYNKYDSAGDIIERDLLIWDNSRFTLKGGQYIIIENLPEGTTYQITEADYDFETSYEGESGVIKADATSTSSFTNSRKGALRVEKTVSHNAVYKNDEFEFTVSLDDKTINGEYGEMTFKDGVATFKLRHGESKTAEGLIAGIGYTVREISDDKYITTSVGETGTIIYKNTQTASFTNTHKVGGLEVRKTVSANAQDIDDEFIFTVTLDDKTINGTYGEMTFKDGVATFKLRHGESKTAEGLMAGVGYTVTEDSDNNYDTTHEGETGTIAADEIKTASFTNIHKEGRITVEKVFTGDLTAEDFEGKSITVNIMQGDEVADTLTLNAENEWTTTSKMLPVGEYTLVEDASHAQAEGYTFTSEWEGLEDGSAIVTKDSITELKLKNHYQKDAAKNPTEEPENNTDKDPDMETDGDPTEEPENNTD